MKERKIIIGLVTVVAIIISLIFILVINHTNVQVLDTTYKYNSAYIFIDGEWTKVGVSSWKDYDVSDSIQIKTTDGVTYYTHLSNVILIAD